MHHLSKNYCGKIKFLFDINIFSVVIFQLDNYFQSTQDSKDLDFCLCFCEPDHSIVLQEGTLFQRFMLCKCKKSTNTT